VEGQKQNNHSSHFYFTLHNKRSLFWFLQTFGWGGFLVVNIIFEDPSQLNNFRGFFAYSITFILGFFISLILWRIYRKLRQKERSIFNLSFYIILYSLISGVIWWLIDLWISQPLWTPEIIEQINEILDSTWLTFSWMIRYSLNISLWGILYFLINFWIEWNDQKTRAEKATILAQSAQLEMLRYQLNPHFLFNTLSSLRALVRNKENDIAEEMVTKISEFLKYSLLEGEESKVPLSREIKTINHYFDIERIRFGEELIVDYDIDPKTENIEIPVFLIHPLVENAIKHGMKTSPSPLKITIKTKLANHNFAIDIINSGTWIEQEIGDEIKGTGLENTRKRLELAYKENHTFEIVKKEGFVQIRIIFNIEAN
jgi:two-component system, LytTR family, sensor kinase